MSDLKIDLSDIKLSLFTQDEYKVIESLLRNGHYEELTHAIAMDSVEKEHAINKILEKARPAIKRVIDSKVEKELAVAPTIQSPEEEAAWQAKLDAERSVASVSESATAVVPAPKPRGRPKKVKTEDVAPDAAPTI